MRQTAIFRTDRQLRAYLMATCEPRNFDVFNFWRNSISILPIASRPIVMRFEGDAEQPVQGSLSRKDRARITKLQRIIKCLPAHSVRENERRLTLATLRALKRCEQVDKYGAVMTLGKKNCQVINELMLNDQW